MIPVRSLTRLHDDKKKDSHIFFKLNFDIFIGRSVKNSPRFQAAKIRSFVRLRIELRLVIWSFLHRKSACIIMERKSGNGDMELFRENCQYVENPRIIFFSVHAASGRVPF